MNKELKAVSYRVKPQQTIWAVTIRIEDDEAGTACLMREFTGFNIDDAKRNANKRLNRFGYKVE